MTEIEQVESHFVPTTEQVCGHWVEWVSIHGDSATKAEAGFRSWLAGHDAEVAAKALLDAYSLPCDAECSAFNEGPQQECSRHGRTPADLWSTIDKLSDRLSGAVKADMSDGPVASAWRYRWVGGRPVQL